MVTDIEIKHPEEEEASQNYWKNNACVKNVRGGIVSR